MLFPNPTPEIIISVRCFAQSASLPWYPRAVDRFIEVCGATHLSDCEGKFVRLCYVRPGSVIKAVAHVVEGVTLDIDFMFGLHPLRAKDEGAS